MRILSPLKIFNYVYRYVTKDPMIISHRKWLKDNAEHLRIDYDLTSDSIVFDLGGYKGDWTNEIYNKYKCSIFVFEPVHSFYENIKKRFQHIDKIKVCNFGLSNFNKEDKISVNEDGSSTMRNWNKSFQVVKLFDIVEFIETNNIKKIDLVKINIEGGEYEVLSRLIDAGHVQICKNLQIQFHSFIKDAYILRDNIRSNLSLTHHLTYDYPWIWENWCLN